MCLVLIETKVCVSVVMCVDRFRKRDQCGTEMNTRDKMFPSTLLVGHWNRSKVVLSTVILTRVCSLAMHCPPETLLRISSPSSRLQTHQNALQCPRRHTATCVNTRAPI